MENMFEIGKQFKTLCLRLADELGPSYRVIIVNDSFANIVFLQKTFFLKLFGIEYCKKIIGSVSFHGIVNGRARWKSDCNFNMTEHFITVKSAMVMVAANSDGQFNSIVSE